MRCPNCDAEIGDNDQFCWSCGSKTVVTQQVPYSTPSSDLPTSSMPAVATSGIYAGVGPNTSGAPTPNSPASNTRSKGPLIIGIVIAAVVVAALIAGAFIWFNTQQTTVIKHMAHSVSISVTAPGYSEKDTLIPMNVEGEDIEGNEVSYVQFIDPNGKGLELSKGSYSVSVAASPLTDDGILYNTPSTVYNIEIPEDYGDQESIDLTDEISIELEKSTALEETQEMIDAAYANAIIDTDQVAKANDLKKIAEEVHEEAVAAEEKRLAEEEAERQRQEEEAERKRQEEEAERQRQEEEAQKKAEKEARKNPASVNAVNGPVTLKGTIVRKEYSMEETGMGWAAVVYFLEFDEPVTITYKAASGTMTESLNHVQVGSQELYAASGGSTDTTDVVIERLQPFVGEYVAVTGDLLDGGTMHYFAPAFIGDYTIVEL